MLYWWTDGVEVVGWPADDKEFVLYWADGGQ